MANRYSDSDNTDPWDDDRENWDDDDRDSDYDPDWPYAVFDPYPAFEDIDDDEPGI